MRNIDKYEPTFEGLKRAVVQAGYIVSPCSWEDGEAIFVFSQEGNAPCYGHPEFEASYSKLTGWMNVGQEWKYIPVTLTT